jgi:hypothetical protein
VRGRVLQQHRLPPALGCVSEVLLAAQSLALLEKIFRLGERRRGSWLCDLSEFRESS